MAHAVTTGPTTLLQSILALQYRRAIVNIVYASRGVKNQINKGLRCITVILAPHYSIKVVKKMKEIRPKAKKEHLQLNKGMLDRYCVKLPVFFL